MNAATLVSASLGSVVGLILALTGASGAIGAVTLLVLGLGLSVAQAAPIGLFPAVALTAERSMNVFYLDPYGQMAYTRLQEQ